METYVKLQVANPDPFVVSHRYQKFALDLCVTFSDIVSNFFLVAKVCLLDVFALFSVFLFFFLENVFAVFYEQIWVL